MSETATKRTSLLDNGLIWFGAGVSIAEIITGTYFAPLGWKTGLMAILLGHLIGGILFYLVGLMGGKIRSSSMEIVKRSFGQQGGQLFAILNFIQLVGWTAIMIYDGSLAANEVLGVGSWLWSIVIGALILIWIAADIFRSGKISTVAMVALFILTLLLSKVIFIDNAIGGTAVSGEAMSFGAAVELAIAMPLSWLPLISDYTREAVSGNKATLVSTLSYSIVSCWMYFIGMGAAILTTESDIAKIMLKAGLGIVGLLIIIFSTVTTTFLDAFSAGITSESVLSKVNSKWIALGVTVIGTIGAICYPMDDITEFLYYIGSVFAPMAAVQIADFYILRHSCGSKKFDWVGLAAWLIGFGVYRWFMNLDLSIGSTLPAVVVTLIVTIVLHKIIKPAGQTM